MSRIMLVLRGHVSHSPSSRQMSHSQMSHSQMPHSQMSHSQMSHSQMSHSQMSHSQMPHSQMSHSQMPHSHLSAASLFPHLAGEAIRGCAGRRARAQAAHLRQGFSNRDPFSPYVRAHYSHISPLNSLFATRAKSSSASSYRSGRHQWSTRSSHPSSRRSPLTPPPDPSPRPPPPDPSP